MSEPRHTEPIPAGWRVDKEDWLYRRTKPGDAAITPLLDRAFIEGQYTYCSEVWEARKLDGGTR